jgi:L-amino acid N-acyltransferase YncA
MESTTIRTGAENDAAALADIYGYHVLHGTASFETEPPTVAQWTEKIASILSRGWPLLVAEHRGAVVGYTYAMQFRDRPAYVHTCENSIYLLADARGQGIGHQLLTALLPAARIAGFQQMIAVVGGAEPASVALHQKAGFRVAGRMVSVGYKFSRWLDTVYMQLDLTA